MGEEIGDFGVEWLVVVMDAEAAGEGEARVLIEVDIALHADGANAHLAGTLQGVLQQSQPVALALVGRGDGDGTEGGNSVRQARVRTG